MRAWGGWWIFRKVISFSSFRLPLSDTKLRSDRFEGFDDDFHFVFLSILRAPLVGLLISAWFIGSASPSSANRIVVCIPLGGRTIIAFGCQFKLISG